MHPNIWYPFTIIKGAEEPLKVKEGRGIWLTLEDGHRIIDCISSWWVNIHGHSHPEMTKAIARQSEILEHVIFSNFTHQPAETLAEMLTEKLPNSLNRVFFSDNGSTAVEVALKMALMYWRNSGSKRNRFIAFEGAYHGDTMGAMSAGSRSVFTQVFSDLMFDVDYIPYPSTWIGDNNADNREDHVIQLLKEKIEKNPDSYAGIIIEPLIQGVAGMRVSREQFLKKLKNECRRSGLLLIFDEVMTGFGRTGDWFAATRSGVDPDIICLAKGLTGGFLPLSVTVCSDDIYETFNSSDPLKTLWHGHSYTANPLGCAAAIASMKLLEANEDQFMSMEEKHKENMGEITRFEKVVQPRIKGTIAAFSIDSGDSDSYLNSVASVVKKHCVDYDLLLRPLGNIIYLMPPYCITGEELHMVYKKMALLLERVVFQNH